MFNEEVASPYQPPVSQSPYCAGCTKLNTKLTAYRPIRWPANRMTPKWCGDCLPNATVERRRFKADMKRWKERCQDASYWAKSKLEHDSYFKNKDPLQHLRPLFRKTAPPQGRLPQFVWETTGKVTDSLTQMKRGLRYVEWWTSERRREH